MEDHVSKLLFLILILNIAQSTTGNVRPGVFEEGKDSSKNSIFCITFGGTAGQFPHQKRSVLTHHRYDRLRELQRMKRILSDYGYGSRLQAGENVANLFEREGLFGVAGPGKRSAELIGFDMLNESKIKAKRINTDYGYGSRLQAAENIAKNWDRNGLFGVMGPGKRSDIDKRSRKERAKRIVIDFGYGSRSQAAENAAKSSSNEKLFGVHGPGKRKSASVDSTGSLGYGMSKRLTDYGYGSRLKAAENAAKYSSSAKLFGTYGPGK